MDSNLKVVYAEVEDVEGVAETLTTAMLCRMTNFATRQGTMKDLNNIQAHYGAQKSLYMGTYSTITLEVDVVGSGTAGVAPSWIALPRMCGRAVEVVEDTSVTLSVASVGHESGTIGLHIDGELHVMVGCRGTMATRMNEDDHLVAVFEIWGLTVEPTTVALPAPNFSSWLEPLPLTKANTTFSLHGYAGVLSSLELRDGFTVDHRDKPGAQGIHLRGRNGAGTVQIDLPTIGAKNYHATIKNHATGPLSLTVGTVAGRIVTLSCPKVQLVSPSFPDADGVVQLNATLKLLPNSPEGDDEFDIVFT